MAVTRLIRRYRTVYAGIERMGYCNTRESAMEAAFGHLAKDGYTACSVVDLKTNLVVANLRVSADRTKIIVITEHALKGATK